jgi:acetyltransferase-like isoleucine patch superfamily enzyme
MCLRAFVKRLWIAYLNISTNSSVAFSASVNFRTRLEGRNTVHDRAVLSGSSLGFASFVGPNSCLPNAEIGRYCSIADHVNVVTHTHPSSTFVSTHPAFYSLLRQAGFTYATSQKFVEGLTVSDDCSISTRLENDVWIGSHVLIIGGVTIGNGAIIAAGSVVTKNVAPYTVVGGVPARPIRKRFNEEEIAFLLQCQWWDKGEGWIEKHAGHFTDIKVMMRCFELED